MHWLKGWLKQLRTLFRKESVERELEEELQFHVEQQIRENVRAGMDLTTARRSALVAFGGVERYKEQRREASWVRWLEDLLADVRYAGRMLARRPGFASAVILTLALSIGGTTAIFSVVDGLFLRAPAGVRHAEDVRKLFIRRNAGGIQAPEGGPGSYVDYETMRANVKAFASVSAYSGSARMDVGRGEDAEQLRGVYTTHEFLSLLGVRPALGRLMVAEDNVEGGANQVAVISHSLWQTQFGSARDVVGRTLWINGKTVTIIGVTEQGFSGIEAEPADVYMPMAASGIDKTPLMIGIHFIARLAPGSSDTTAIQQGTAALAQAATLVSQLDPTPELMTLPLRHAAQPERSPAANLSLWLVLVAVFVLVIACANVTNLLLARAVAARREISVRLALGASRARLLRQQITESTVLALLGGAAGLVVAHWSLGLMRQFPMPPTVGTLDLRILAFTFAISTLTGLAVGILPAAGSKRQPIENIRESRSTLTRGGTRTRRILVGVQVTLSVMLLIGAALFVRSLRSVHDIDPGVDVERTAAVTINIRRAGFSAPEAESFYQQALERLAQAPYVERAALVQFHPFSGNGMGVSFRAPGADDKRDEEGPYLNAAGRGFFAAVGTRVLQGREFDQTDRPGTEPVAVVNERMARAIVPDGSVVGKCVPFDDQVEKGGCTRIVGVVENYRHRYLQPGPIGMVFLAREQNPARINWGGPALVVRTRGPAGVHTAEIQALVQNLRSDLPFARVRSLAEIIRPSVLPHWLGATLFTLFGALALVLSAVGLAGVLGYFVTERTAEIGIRRSLGAPARNVVSLVVRQALLPVCAGVVVGVAAALAGSRFIASLLFGVDARDHIAFSVAVIVLLATAIVATLLPARRAASIDPLLAVRQE